MRFLFIRTAADIPTDVPVLGIEIPGNRPDLLDRCSLGNIDPQHGGSEATGRCAALEAAILRCQGVFDALPRDTVFIMTRIDLDAIACTVVALGLDLTDPVVHERLRAIDRADSFTAGKWPGPRPLPTAENPWPQVGGAGEVEELAAVDQVCRWATRAGGDRLTLDQAVAIVGHWLRYGEVSIAVSLPKGIDVRDLPPGMALSVARYEATVARVAVAQAVESGALPMSLCYRSNDESVIVMPVADPHAMRRAPSFGPPEFVYTDASASPLASDSSAGLAYCLAPVSVIRAKDGRFSIAAFDDGRIDFARLKSRMNEIEPGWGGPARMCSSPMGRASALSPEQVLREVAAALI